MTYKKVVELGVKLFLPVWEKSDHIYGYLSGQVDPRDCFDAERMLNQALDIAPLAPNVMVKVPGTREGYQVIEELTAGDRHQQHSGFYGPPICCLHGSRSKRARQGQAR